MQLSSSTKNSGNTLDFLSGGGEMGQRIREFNWAETSIGTPDTWPSSLRTCIRIMLTSRQPIWIGWGNDLIKFYNDPYKSIVGGKHPWALGKPVAEVWKDIWHDIEPMLDQVMHHNQGTYVESQLLIMERNGYPEETYYTFSYTPIPGDDGTTAGVFCANTDDTNRIIVERQLKTLTQLGKNLAECKQEVEIFEKSIATFKDNPQDFPFAYLRKIEDHKAILIPNAYFDVASHVPIEIDLNSSHQFAHVVNTAISTRKPFLLEGIREKLGLLPHGAWKIPPDCLLVSPIIETGAKEISHILVVGVNPYRKLDESYTGFFMLVADQIAASFTDVHALEEERKRAQLIAEIDRAKTNFFTNISHEFRTPLTLILGSLEEVLNNSVPAELNEVLETSHRNAMRLLRLVNNLLDFSRLEAGKIEAQLHPTGIVQQTLDIAAGFRSVIENAGLKFEIITDQDESVVLVDHEMWEKIVLNLLSNAFKYTLQGSITLTLTNDKNNFIFKIKDTGVGIPEKELPKMFQRFHRIQQVTGRTFEGTGIGLSLVSELITLQNGTITVQSIEGSGSEFTITLPLHTSVVPSEKSFIHKNENIREAFIDEAISLADDDIIPGKPATQTTEKENILIVDDNGDMRKHLHAVLKNNYNVLQARDGHDAIKIITDTKPDLILSDIMMPGMDGIQLMNYVKSNPAIHKIPVILLSARAGEEARIEGIDLGADDYLTKPFSAKELLSRVKSNINTYKKRQLAEDNLRNIIMKAPVAMTVLRGPDYIIEQANEKALNIWGKSYEQVIDKPAFVAFPELKDQGFEQILSQVYNQGIPFIANEMPVTLVRNHKPEDLFINFIYEPLKNPEGNIEGIVGIGIDVSEQVRIRKIVEDKEEKLRMAISGAALGLYNYYPQTGNLYWSERTKELFGLPPDADITFETFINGIHPDDREQVKNLLQQTFNHSSGEFQESVYRTIGYKDNQLRWIRSKGKVSFDTEGKALRLTGIMQDITLQKESEIEVARFRYMADNAKDPFILMREDGSFAYLNKLALEKWQYTEEEAKSLRVPDVDPNYNDEKFNEVFARAQAEVIPPFETLHKNKSGHIYPVEVNMGGLPLEGVPYMFAVARDITERKQTEEILVYRKAILEAQNEAIPDAMLIVDTQGKILSANQNFLRLWKIPDAIMHGHDDTAALKFAMTQLKHPEEFIDRVNYCYAHPDQQAYDEIEFLDGRIIERYGNSVIGENGTRFGWVWVFRDLTERKKAEANLKESESRFRTLTQSLPQLIWMANPDGYCNFFNQQWYDYTGSTPEQSYGNGWTQYIHPDQAPALYTEWKQKLETGEPIIFEFQARAKDGSYQWFYVEGNALKDEDDKIIKWIGTLTNIDERKKWENTLKENEERFRTFADNIQNLAWVADGEGWIYWYNQRWYDYTGTNLEEMRGWGWEKVHHPDHIDRVVNFVKEAWKINEPWELTFPLKGADGIYRWFLTRAVPVTDEAGKINRWIGTNTNINEQKLAEDKIRENESRFRTLAETLPQLIWVSDEKGNNEYYNDQWKIYSGIENLEGSWRQIIHPDDAAISQKAFDKALASGEPFRYEVRLKNKAGEYRWHNSIAEPVTDPSGIIIKWIGAITDIHDQKTLAQKLEQLVADRTRELQRSNEDLQQFAHVASHDLKEPVRKIKTFGSRLREEFENELPIKASTYIQKMESAANRVYAMIDGVLLYSALDATEQPKEAVDLNEIISDLLVDLEVLINEKKARIQYDRLPVIEGSSILLYQLFYNLVNNSLKFSSTKRLPLIKITASPAGKKPNQPATRKAKHFTKITVADNGIGFSMSEASDIFKTFSRLHSRDLYEGTGLGLSLCKKIVERHDGMIEAEGVEGKGASFHILLPVSRMEK